MDTEEFQHKMLDRLERLERSLETISAQLCPVCGPQLVQERHPETAAQVSNGKTSAKV